MKYTGWRQNGVNAQGYGGQSQHVDRRLALLSVVKEQHLLLLTRRIAPQHCAHIVRVIV